MPLPEDSILIHSYPTLMPTQGVNDGLTLRSV